MMPDIFSSFDPYVFSSLFPSNTMFLLMNMMMIMAIQMPLWMSYNRWSAIKLPFITIMFSQLMRTTSHNLKGLSTFISSLFLMIIVVNLLGLVPYIFSSSSHLIFTLSMGFPVWLSLIMSSFALSPKKSTAHFLPDGAPDWLNPFLVLIETTSVLVRPLTLSFRLAANMSAGHIVLSLIGIYCSSAVFSGVLSYMNLTMFMVGYVLFEVAICLIQAYIFCLLLSLYSDDHAH